MMRRRLPPLNPLRSFEAAGRHGSFTRAAAELHVTPVAVSRQVAVLEEYFGTRLFDRLHQAVQLTPAGRQLMNKVTAALDLLDEGAQLLRPQPGRSLLVCTYTTVALRWLIPRLASFRERFPDIDIDIATAVTTAEFNYQDIDVGIQFLQGRSPPELVATPLLPDVIQPVASPVRLKGQYPLPPLENLRHHPFLHSGYRRDDWSEWLRFAGVKRFRAAEEFTFKGSGLAYQAATEGLGVAMAQRLLVAEDLAQGRLATPFAQALHRQVPMSMVMRRARLNDPHVELFCGWLEAQAEQCWRALGLTDLAPRKGTVLVELC